MANVNSKLEVCQSMRTRFLLGWVNVTVSVYWYVAPPQIVRSRCNQLKLPPLLFKSCFAQILLFLRQSTFTNWVKTTPPSETLFISRVPVKAGTFSPTLTRRFINYNDCGLVSKFICHEFSKIIGSSVETLRIYFNNSQKYGTFLGTHYNNILFCCMKL